jgi:hypothetical protein
LKFMDDFACSLGENFTFKNMIRGRTKYFANSRFIV